MPETERESRDPAELRARIDSLESKLERERKAREEAEQVAERGMRQLYEEQDRTTLLQEITEAAHEVDTAGEAFDIALEKICRYINWPIGHVYLHDEERNDLAPADSWYYEDASRFENFIDVTRSTRFDYGEGLPGRVLKQDEAAWIRDVHEDDNFPRSNKRDDLEVHGAFGFPVRVEENISAVLEFFTPSIEDPDDDVLEIMDYVGTQLGRVVERERSKRRIEYLAHYDNLTDLPNRNHFNNRLSERLQEYKSPDRPLAVVFIDLNGFKEINDAFGHDVGDDLLVKVAEELDKTLSEEAFVARWGGDEFTVILPGCSSKQEIESSAEQLLDALESSFYVEDQRFLVQASAGISLYPENAENAEDLISRADLAMYEAKKRSGSEYEFYESGSQEDKQEKITVLNKLRDAVDRESFVSFFQPQISTDDQSVGGVEALARWRDDEWGLVSPGRFIQVAEASGLIIPIGEQVIREACRTVSDWHDRGYEELDLGVNVSFRRLHETDFLGTIQEILADTGFNPERLEIELTESTLMQNIDAASSMIRELKDLGISVAIDDFGTGYSALSYLLELPFSTLKIDRSFVMKLGEDINYNELVETICLLGEKMKFDLVAEGAEDPYQAVHLEELGVDLIQGFLYARPMDHEDCLEFLETQDQLTLEGPGD